MKKILFMMCLVPGMMFAGGDYQLITKRGQKILSEQYVNVFAIAQLTNLNSRNRRNLNAMAHDLKMESDADAGAVHHILMNRAILMLVVQKLAYTGI